MNGIAKWSIWLALTACAVIASYLWLDRPIALLAHEQSRPYDLFSKLDYIPGVILPLVIIAFAVIALSALNGRPLSSCRPSQCWRRPAWRSPRRSRTS
jgi:hypothetical protein